MLPERTTTMGEEESVATERPFQSMKAVLRTRAKLRTWVASCRGCSFESSENMMGVVGGWFLVVLVGDWMVVVDVRRTEVMVFCCAKITGGSPFFDLVLMWLRMFMSDGLLALGCFFTGAVLVCPGDLSSSRESVRDVDTCELRLNFGCGELLKLHSRDTSRCA